MTNYYPQDPPRTDGNNTLLYVSANPETVERVESIIERARFPDPSVTVNDVVDMIFSTGVDMFQHRPAPTPITHVIDELSRATEKYPTWPTDPLHAVAILGEEFGELTKAMLQMTYEPHKTNADQIREEAMQTAAMALRLVMSLDEYHYKKCEQHSQNDKPTTDNTK